MIYEEEFGERKSMRPSSSNSEATYASPGEKSQPLTALAIERTRQYFTLMCEDKDGPDAVMINRVCDAALASISAPEKPQPSATQTDALEKESQWLNVKTREVLAWKRAKELERELVSMTAARDYCLRTMNEAIEENTALRLRTEKAEEARDAARSYAAANPLGGPASMFRTIAERIEAGEEYMLVLADYGLVHDAPRSATGRILPEESTVEIQEVICDNIFGDWRSESLKIQTRCRSDAADLYAAIMACADNRSADKGQG